MTTKEPTELECRVATAMRAKQQHLDRQRWAMKRPRPKWLGPGGVQEQHDIELARVAIRLVRDAKKWETLA